MSQLWKYKGKPLSPDQQLLLQFAGDQGCTCTVERGDRPATISVLKNGIKLCYINATVIEDSAIVGYTFRSEDGVGKPKNGCPPELLQKTLAKVKKRYSAEQGWKLYRNGEPVPKGKQLYCYLHVMDFNLSKKIIEL
jgi:hypothetical protein